MGKLLTIHHESVYRYLIHKSIVISHGSIVTSWFIHPTNYRYLINHSEMEVICAPTASVNSSLGHHLKATTMTSMTTSAVFDPGDPVQLPDPCLRVPKLNGMCAHFCQPLTWVTGWWFGT